MKTALGSADIVDAEYETVGQAAPSSGPHAEQRRPASHETASGFDMLRTGPVERDDRSRRGGALFWSLGAAAVLVAFWISGGYALLGAGPFPTASRQTPDLELRIASLTSRVETRGGRSVLLVDGEAVNDGARVRNLPRLSIDVLGKDGATTRYFLGTNDPALAPGETFAFSSRLVAPKDGVESVSVTIGENED